MATGGLAHLLADLLAFDLITVSTCATRPALPRCSSKNSNPFFVSSMNFLVAGAPYVREHVFDKSSGMGTRGPV